MIDAIQNILTWVLVLTGAATWIFGGLIVLFYWLCRRPS